MLPVVRSPPSNGSGSVQLSGVAPNDVGGVGVPTQFRKWIWNWSWPAPLSATSRVNTSTCVTGGDPVGQAVFVSPVVQSPMMAASPPVPFGVGVELTVTDF